MTGPRPSRPSTPWPTCGPVTLDPAGTVRAGNFVFQGTGCPLDPASRHRSVSQFGADGPALSPRTGWQVGGIVQPQGMVADCEGMGWVANCGGRSVVKPFGVTVDPGTIRL